MPFKLKTSDNIKIDANFIKNLELVTIGGSHLQIADFNWKGKVPNYVNEKNTIYQNLIKQVF